MQPDRYFTAAPSVESSRVLYTPSGFARSSLLHLQEVGALTAIAPHTSRREKLCSYLCFVVEGGEGSLCYEGEHYSLKPGDVVFIDCAKQYSHSTGLSPEQALWSLRWCHFYGPSMAAVYAKYRERGGTPVIHNSDSGAFSTVISQLHALASGQDYIRDMRINEKLNVLLTLVMETSWHWENQINAPKRMEVSHIRAYLDEHYQEKISLESIAEMFFVDKYYLSRLFKAQYGVTMMAYLQQVRVTHAKQMLRFSQKSVEEIGLECGIGAQSYFSRVFKKMEGVSPSEFRNMW